MRRPIAHELATLVEEVAPAVRGLDLDPAYVDVAIDRWTAMTGGTPERIERRTA